LYLFLADICEVPDTKTCKPLMIEHNMIENVPHHQTLNFKDRDLEESLQARESFVRRRGQCNPSAPVVYLENHESP
jgi:hypothetical protein